MGAVEKKCPKCGGEGVLGQLTEDGENDSLVECECAIIKRFSFAMPAEVRMAVVSKAHADHPVAALMGRSLYIKSTYADMLSIIKVAIYKTQGRYHVRMTSDAEIRDVGVGSRSRKAKGEDARDVYNDFMDLMESPPLMVVWLNKLGHKNRAAAGYLMEALTVRLDKRKPTWVVSDLDNMFGSGSFSYSDALWSFLNIGFEHVSVPRILKFDEVQQKQTVAPQSVAPRQAPKLEVEYAPAQQEPFQRKGAPIVADDDEKLGSLSSLGTAKKKSKYGRGGPQS